MSRFSHGKIPALSRSFFGKAVIYEQIGLDIYQLTFMKKIVYLIVKFWKNFCLKEFPFSMAFKDITLGQYAPRDSFIHRLDPRTKVTIHCLAMFLSLFINRISMLCILGILGLFLFWTARLPVRIALKNAKPFLWLFMLTFLLHALSTDGRVFFRIPFLHVAATREGVSNGFFYSLRIWVLLVFANGLTLTTSPMEFTDALEKFLKPFRKIGVPAHEIALMISISIRFIPIFIDEAERIKNAQISRGGRMEGRLTDRIKGVLPVLIPLFLASFRKANDLAFAMDARCYRGGDNRTHFRILRFHPADWAALTATAGIGMSIFLLDHRFCAV
jgi:energy-coupling factor transport system permease protein